MSLCLNPNCSAANPDGHKFSEKCGSKLFLQERYQAIQLIGQGGFGRTFKAIDRQFKNEVHQCLMIIHRIPQKGFDSQDIFEDDD